MSKQTRRSISLCAKTYDQLREYSLKSNRSMSSVVEEALSRFFKARSNVDHPIVKDGNITFMS